MDENEVIEIFKKFRVIISDDHFVYTSGMHGSVYLAKQRIYQDIGAAYRLCLAIAKNFSGTTDIDVVVGPESGAARLARWTARCLSQLTGHAVANVSAMKVAGGFAIRHSDKRKIKDKNVLVVEDILNTYDTVDKVVELVRHEGGFVIGIGALCDRSDPEHCKKIPNQPRTIALARIPLKIWTEEECLRTKLCAQGVPVNTDLGKGKEFLLKKDHAV